MDNLTHSLVGALLSRAGLNRLAPRTGALSVVAANVPDIDILAGLSPAAYLTYHRHLTHAVVAIPVMALVAVVLTEGLYRLWRRLKGGPIEPASWRLLWLIALIPAATHPALDMMNSYGVRLWLPFSEAWSSWDVLFVIDLVVWAILAAAVVAPWYLPGRVQAAAVAGLIGVAAYIGSAAWMHERVEQTLQAAVYDGARPRETAAFPAPPTPTDWLGYVRADGFELAVPVDALRLSDFDPSRGEKFIARSADPAEETAWDTRLGSAYRGFAQYPLAIVEGGPGGGVRVTLTDFRFLRERQARFACIIQLDQALRVVEQRFGF